MNTKRQQLKCVKAFTLIELLTVIAIIGILAAIIIPTVGSVKTSANKAKTKVQFNQWAAAMSLFKAEYGYYPTIHSSGLVDTTKFAAALTGRNLTTNAKVTTDGNSKGLSFYSIADSELNTATPPVLVDAFGNTEIAVVADTNGDGTITSADGTLASVKALGESSGVAATIPTAGIRADAIFYSAGKGGSTSTERTTNLVTSW
jgi:prepilin-type N-terminal cleavage/methylation domain-containing protein